MRFKAANASLLLALGAGAAPALAQSDRPSTAEAAGASAEPTSAQSQASPGGTAETGGDIIVTAERRTQNLRDVPATIVALSEKSLDSAHVVSTTDLIRITPGLKATSPFSEAGAPNFNIRGIQTIDYTSNQSKPVPLYVNEGIRGLSVFEIMPLYDIERVEVLKGPQGTLYGKNASAGAINIITRTPGNASEGEVTLGYGNYNRREARGAVQTSIIDNVLAVRGAFYALKTDGFVRNVYRNPLGVRGRDPEGIDQLSGRLTFLYTPSSKFEAVLRLQSTAVDGTGAAVHAGYRINKTLTGGVDRTGLGYYEESRDGPGLDRVRDNGVNLNAKLNLGDASLTSITTYDHATQKSYSDYDGLSRQIADSYYDVYGADQYSEELRLQSSTDRRFTWLVGAQYVGDTMDFGTRFGLAQSVLAVSYGNHVKQKRDSYGLFGRVEFKLLPELSFFGGGRYSWDKIQGSLNSASNNFLSNPYDAETINTPQLVDLHIGKKATNFSGEAGLKYKPTPDVTFYASYKQGYRGPALNSQAFFSPAEFNAIKAETTSGYEVGAKARLRTWLEIDTALFRTTFKNQQYLSTEDVSNALVLRLVNAPKSRSQGIEATVTVVPTRGVKFLYAGTFLDAKYKDFVIAGQQVRGDQLVGASKWSHNFDMTYASDLAGGKLDLDVNASFSSRVFFEANNSDVASQRALWLANGRVSWTPGHSPVTIGIWGQNIFNRRYWVNVVQYVDLFGFDLRTRGRPRMIGGDVTLRL